MLNKPETSTIKLPKNNFTMQLGEDPNHILWDLRVKKTLVNRIKFWFFFRLFPFKLISWEKMEE